MECEHKNRETLEDGSTLICVDCGAVLDDVAFNTEPTFNPEGHTGSVQVSSQPNQPIIQTILHRRTYKEQEGSRLLKFLREVSNHFGWSAENEQIFSMFERLAAAGKSDYGKGGERTLAGLYVLLGRQNGLPITLHRMASYTSDSVSNLGHSLNVIVAFFGQDVISPVPQPDRFLVKHLADLNLDFDQEQSRHLKKMFKTFLEYFIGIGLPEGRLMEPFSLALLVVCLESTCTESKLTVEEACAKIGALAPSTVYKRYLEIKRMLVTLARDNLPYGEEVKKGNLHVHLDALCDYLSVLLGNVTRAYDPPSYTKSVSERSRRIALINSVKAGTIPQDDAAMDSFIIECLLEKGMNEEEILALPRISLNLLDEFTFCD